MPEFGFESLSLSLSVALFGGAAFAVWVAGTRIAACAAEISRRSGLGEALMGLLLLAGVTSLPEVATSFTAALDDAELAVNNLWEALRCNWQCWRSPIPSSASGR